MRNLVGRAVWLLVLTLVWVMLSCLTPKYKASAAMDEKVKQALSRNVRVETDNAWGTGVVIQTGVVLTNYHVIEDNTPVKIDGHTAKVVSRSPDKDLAILHYDYFADSPIVPKLQFCERHEQGDEVFWVGNPAGMKNFVVFGRIIGFEGEDIFTDAKPLPGFSGSALYCREHGKCLGINNRLYGTVGIGAPYAITIPAKTTKKFLGEK